MIESLSLETIQQEINDMAAQISVFAPVLNEICDGELDSQAGSTLERLEMIAALSKYINSNLSDIAGRLGRISNGARELVA